MSEHITQARRRFLSRALQGFGCAAMFGGLHPVAWADEPIVYKVGVVPQFDSRTTFDIWTPILAKLQHSTGLQFQLVGSPNIPDFEKKVGQQEFDFVYLNPYQALVVSNNYVP
ncbi:MAG: PhnD/SsuA/transferrin family substrate-binding protein, partial [Rhodoferax sp.]